MSEELSVVVVSTKTGLDIKGILRDVAANGMVLSNAAILVEVSGGPDVWKQLPGEVVIPASNVDYYQKALPVELLATLMEAKS